MSESADAIVVSLVHRRVGYRGGGKGVAEDGSVERGAHGWFGALRRTCLRLVGTQLYIMYARTECVVFFLVY